MSDTNHNPSYEEQLKKMVDATEGFLKFSGSQIDYQQIIDDFMYLCNAKYAVFNLFDSDGGVRFSTVAISGSTDILRKITKILGFGLVGKKMGI